MEPEETGTVCKVLGPGGPHQSIPDGTTKHVVGLIKRSSTTLGLLCRKPEIEGPKPRSSGAIESMKEELLDGEEGPLAKLLKGLETKKMGTV